MAEIKLTPQQQLAVENEGGPLLVSAAAGSGKTKVLVDRVLRRLCDPQNPRDISSFLIITYTKAAAAELRGKLAAAIGEALAKNPGSRHLQRQLSHIYLAQISTVHSFCTGILRDFSHELGLYPDFRVLEEQESALWMQQAMEETLQEAYRSLADQPQRKAFLDRLGAGRDDRRGAEILMQAYRSVQCHPDPAAWIAQCRAAGEPEEDMGRTPWGKALMEDFLERLQEQLAAMERGFRLLSQDEALEARYGPTYQENLQALRRLAAAKTWDELYERRIFDFGRLKAAPKGTDKDFAERCKRPRQQCLDWLKKAQSVFSMPSSQALEELRQAQPVINGMFDLLEDFTARYKAIKQRRRTLDFGDLEHEALRLLRYPGSGAPTPAARELSRRYLEILVDEYQDSNAVQECIFSAISQNGQNLFLVGDVKQSIYRFRLADPGIFLKKYEAYLPAGKAQPGQPRKVILSQNFRSRGEILQAVNDIFSLCMSSQVGDLGYGPEEALYPGLPQPPAAKPCVELHCLDLSQKQEEASKRDLEARLVARRIAALLQEGRAPGDIVILLRSLRSQAPAYLQALAQAGIPAACDQSEDLLESTEVQVLLSYLQVLDNPHQDIPLASVLLSPVWGCSAEDLAQVRIGKRKGDLYDALQASGAFQPFLAQLETLRRAARQEPVAALIRRLWEETNLRDVFCVLPGGEQRMENLQSIYLLASAFDPEGPGRLSDFLAHMEQRRERGITGSGPQPLGAVRLMSIHKSKGLEFPVVIVAGLSTRFNTADERQPVQIHPELGVGCDVVDLNRRIKYPSLAKQAILAKLRQEQLSEELRVLYVALTRPKELLIMCYASQYLETRLRDLAQQLSPEGPVSLSRQANCLGHWVLMAALRRQEAGALFSLAEEPEETLPSQTPWDIRLWTPAQLPGPEPLPEPALAVEALPDPAAVEEALAFRYPHEAATRAPAKLTATQLKGRFLDAESAQDSPEPRPRDYLLRQPLFLQGQRPLSPQERGTAVHLAMQYIRYEACESIEGVQAELLRLQEEGFLLPEQAKCVPPEKITALFLSPLGQRILHAPQVIREFKFSLLTPAQVYDPALAGEELLLQGVTDCCLLEQEGLCVIDFKTDRLSPGQEAQRADRYRGQLAAYSAALSKIFARPVKEQLLYFFATDTAFAL